MFFLAAWEAMKDFNYKYPASVNSIIECQFKLLCLALSLSLVSAAAFIRPCTAKPPARRGGGVYLMTPNPTNPLEHNNRAVELGSKQLWQQALEEHKLALEGDPENITFRRNLSAGELRYADSLRAAKNLPAAITHYRRALFADPGNGPADSNLDYCLHALGKSPGDAAYRLSLAKGAEGTPDHFEDAVVEFRKAAKLSDTGINHFYLGQCLMRGGKVVEGYDELIVALRKDWPKDKENVEALSECHTVLGDTLKDFAYKAKGYQDKSVFTRRLNNAATEYRRAVTVNPSNSNAIRGLRDVGIEAVAINPSFRNQMLLGGAYLLQADFDHAKLCYEKAWRAEPTNPDLAKARIAYHQAVVESALATPMRVAETVQKVDDLIKLNPNDAQLWYILARGRDRQGEKATAIEAAQKAIGINKFVNPLLVPFYNNLTGQGPDPAATAAGTTGAAASATAGTLGGTPGAAGAAGTPGATAAASSATAKPAVNNSAGYAKIESLIKENKLDEAIKEADTLAGASPSDGKIWLLEGTALEKQGKLDDAATCYRQAAGLKEAGAADALRQINTSRVQPLLNDAEKLITEKNYAGALAILKEAIILAPNLPSLHRKAAQVLKAMSDEGEAAKENKKADDLEKAK
ncbi:MAG: tetratricopeptide repeat protein [Candidatus Obscuribacterales bacterium]